MLGDGVELVEGDFADTATLRMALRGAERVLLSSADGPDKVAHETAVVDAAAEAGVRLVVKCSTIGAAAGSPLPPFDWHGQIEEHLARSGVPAVVLRSCFYMTNLLASSEQVREHGRLFAPAGDGRIAMIDPRDTGSVAARVLLEDGHAGREYVLTGPAAVTFEDVAAALSRAVGATVSFVDVPDDAARAELVVAGLPDWLVRHLGELFPRIRAGLLEQVTGEVRVLTGREPRSLAAFVEDHRHVFAGTLVHR